MKKLLFSITIALSLFALASCGGEDNPGGSSSESPVFSAVIDNSLTLNGQKVNWELRDEININGAVYTASPKGDATKADFTKKSGADPASPYKAIFPASLYKTDHFDFPANQTYAANKINVPMFAQSETTSLSFKSIFGVLKISVPSTTTVKTIKVSSDLVMNGSFTVDNNVARMSKTSGISDSDKTLTLDCGSGVAGTDFFIVIPAGTYTGKNFKIVVIDSSNKEQVMIASQTEDISVAANVVYSINFMDNSAIDLSLAGTANCYIVSEAGQYKFKAVKGNSSEPAGDVKGVKVLWESFGTDTAPSVGEIIKADVEYKDGYIYFSTNDKYQEGNAVIAAYGDVGCSDGNVLWSWHIWCTDEPESQVYANNAGTMMDRNLGATSATPGDVGALGLYYQWGRKDPFLGSSSISEDYDAASTITWPSRVISDSETGTIAYATANPTTFIAYDDNINDNNYDWYFTGNKSTDNTRWNRSKTVYDPCPAGWRVPDGGKDGVWMKAFRLDRCILDFPWDNTNRGVDFMKEFGTANQCWYPAASYNFKYGSPFGVGYRGYYWSCTPDNNFYACCLQFFVDDGEGEVGLMAHNFRTFGQSVRCQAE